MKKAAFFLTVILAAALPAGASAPVLELQLLGASPRAGDSYTQGLFIRDGLLFESSGLYGRSAFSRAPLDDPGPPGRRWALPGEYFAEGAAWAGGEIYLLTWRGGRGFVLDPETLAVRRVFAYQGEGWGLAWDGRRLWRSDGSDRLFPHRAGDFAPAGEPLPVRDGEAAVTGLNELEWDPETGLLLANIYGADQVAAIDPRDGSVRFWLNAAPLRGLAVRAGLSAAASWDTVLNGLALSGDSLWLTGKFWPLLFRAAWPPEGWDKSAGDL